MFPQTVNGFTSTLQPVTRPLTSLAPQEVLIRVRYAGVNRADLLQMQGLYAPPEGATDSLGLEAAGEIAAVGTQVTRWRAGDEVCALLPGGGYADYAVAQEGHCLPLPIAGDMALAAALPECVTTVWLALFKLAHLRPRERVLVHGGASGIGTTAIQMITAAGAHPVVTVGTAEKAAFCERLGAQAIDYLNQDFVAVVKQKGGVDCVLDCIGGDYIPRNIKALKPYGRLVTIACLKGAQAEVPLGSLLMKQLSWYGLSLRNRTDEDKTLLLREIEATVWPWVAQGKLRPVIDSLWPLSQAADALQRMEKGLHCGKILLQVP